ncbi:MAG TPA: AmmeMemoRadiSam system protein A [Candidatus Tenderia sp.]|nr:AmmeMemoRadiSam system protein A [Candidatus Tenderia sp.]
MDSKLSTSQKQTLLALARESIRYGLEHGTVMPVPPERYDTELQKPGACFVTLTLAAELRGCIGSLEAYRPLVVDVAHNAYAAAFSDPRFAPLSRAELAQIKTEISVLNPAEEISANSEAALLAQLRPGIDGLILQEGQRRGTFLPSVWQQLPTAAQFLTHLKLKAGLPANYWSDTLRFFRYTTTQFGEE